MDQGLVSGRFMAKILEFAIKEADIAMIYHLLGLGADPSNSTNLCLAVHNYSRPDIPATLLDSIPRLLKKVHGLETEALVMAIKLGLPGLKMVQVLLERGAKVNTEATRRLLQTPLQEAAASGCLEMVQLSLGNNADVNALPAPRGGGTAM